MNPDGAQKEDNREDKGVDKGEEAPAALEDAPVAARVTAPPAVRDDGPAENAAAANPPSHGLQRFWQTIVGQLLRSKHFLQAGALRGIDACKGLLRRLRKRAAKPEDEEAAADERHPARDSRPEKKGKAREEAVKEPAPEEAPAHATRSWLHNLIIYALVLVIGGIVGMTFSFALLSKMLFNQAQRIENQQDEIAQLEKQYSKILESEARHRGEAKELQRKLNDIEAAAAVPNVATDPSGAEPAGSSPGSVTARQPMAKKTGNCKLDAGNVDGNLTRCIDEFNRR